MALRAVVITHGAYFSDARNRFFTIIITAFCLDVTCARQSLRAVIIAAILAHTFRNTGFAPNQHAMTSVRLDIGSKEQQHEKAA